MRLVLLLLFVSSYALAAQVTPSFCVFATRCGDLGHPEGSRALLLLFGAVALISFVLFVASLAPRAPEPESEVVS